MKKQKSNFNAIIKKLVYKKFGNDDNLYKQAKDYFSKEELVSTALIQRNLKVSYIRAAYIINRMMDEGFCDKQQGAKPCKVLTLKN